MATRMVAARTVGIGRTGGRAGPALSGRARVAVRAAAAWHGESLLVLVTVAWGASFLLSQGAVARSEPFVFLALRSAVGALVLAAVLWRRGRRPGRTEVAAGILLGCIIFACCAMQGAGLQLTTSSRAGFLTGLSVAFVPALAALVFRQRPTTGALVGVALSVAGLGALALAGGGGAFGPGDGWILGGAILLAAHVVVTGRVVVRPDVDPLSMATVQVAVAAALSVAASVAAGEDRAVPDVTVWATALGMGTVVTAFGIGASAWAQRTVDGNRAALILSLEPAWAGVFGAAAGEAVGAAAWLGCALIVLGAIVGGHRWRSADRAPADRSPEEVRREGPGPAPPVAHAEGVAAT